MSRVAPTRGSKTLSFLFILLSALLLYLDTTYKSFEGIKNIYKSFEISTSYFFKKLAIDPILYVYELSSDKTYLIKENKELKLALDESHLYNFVISKDSNFFANDELIEAFIIKNGINDIFYLSKVRSFDTQLYFCCSQHRVFIEIFNKPSVNLVGSPVINSSGIIGQVIHDNDILEVLLLTDKSHVIPVESKNHFCNAEGNGTPGKIYCTYSTLLWPEEIKQGQSFLSSGMGGVYPKGLLVGFVGEIKKIDDSKFRFEIELVSDPLQENILGVLENL
jgi:cell shape-determining protein MreC